MLKGLSVEELVSQTNLQQHLCEPFALKCKLNAMKFLKIFILQNRSLHVDSLQHIFRNNTFESFREWFHEQTSFVHSKMKIKRIGIKEIFIKNSM